MNESKTVTYKKNNSKGSEVNPINDIPRILRAIEKIKNKQGDIYSSFSFLPWFIVLFCLYIIGMFLIKIEVNSLDSWEVGKCSSKYVFFSGYLKNNGDPVQTSIDNFQECVKRFL